MALLVSILIPAYDARKWISDSIDSALAQTWKSKEVIVVDDGSRDDTLRVAKKFECKHLKVIHQENGGASSARNRAFRECQGQYVQWLDADDVIARDKIERQLMCSSENPEPDVLLASAWGRFFYRPNKAIFEPTPLWQDRESVEWLVLQMQGSWMMPPVAWLVSRELTESAGPWNEQLSLDDDGEYFNRVGVRSSRIAFIGESRCYYRVANGLSLSKTVSRKAWESLLLANELSVSHLLNRENSERTRGACIAGMSRTAETLKFEAPDLAEKICERIAVLGGEILSPPTTGRFRLAKMLLGEKSARSIKSMVWKATRFACACHDFIMAKVAGNPDVPAGTPLRE
jgi:glycosyltransferase involved in cell wall biosynthesis